MSKEKSLETIRLNGKNHSMYRCMRPFWDIFKLLENNGFVDDVGIGRYILRPELENGFKIKTYSDVTNFYGIDVVYQGKLQKFFLKVPEDGKKKFESFLEECLRGSDWEIG